MASQDESGQAEPVSRTVVFPSTSPPDSSLDGWVKARLLTQATQQGVVMLPVKIWVGKRIALWWWGLMLKYMGTPT